MVNRFFAFVITHHSVFGEIPVPMLLREDTHDSYTVEGTLNEKSLPSSGSDLSASGTELVKIASQYSDSEIYKRFNNKKITQKQFFDKLDPLFIENILKPYFEKRWSQIFQILAETGIPLFYKGKDKIVSGSRRIHVQLTKADVVFNFIRNQEGIRYFQNIRFGNQTLSLTGSKAVMLTRLPVWLLIHNHLLSFSGEVDWNKLKAFLDKEFIFVPGRMEEKYFETFIKPSIRKFKVIADGFIIREIHPPKKAVISIENSWEGQASIILTYRYGEKIIFPHYPPEKQVELKTTPNQYEFFTFQRDLIWEEEKIDLLRKMGLVMRTESFFQLPGSEKSKNSLYNLVKWLNDHAENLESSGVIIQQERLDVQYYTGNIRLHFTTSAQADWFDVYAEVELDNGFKIPFVELRANILNDEREFRLPDGRMVLLPPEWFSKYKELMLFGRGCDQTIRLKKYHASWVLDQGEYNIEKTLKFFRELTGLNTLEKPAVPVSLKTSLREYQKEGFYWMDLLRRGGFGGILADDMGLGKTVQAITMLLKEYENVPVQKKKPSDNTNQLSLFDDPPELPGTALLSSLIIVPTSLIHNWLLEIRKFAPKLKSYQHTGADRLKRFDQIPPHHLLITSYGILRNDIEIFKNQSFHYIFLDESQIIKNPMSKTHQAVMALHGKNRVVLSGTPIENSLGDLWSQMHFLNPGLLGGKSFFRKFFINTIEKEFNEERKNKLKAVISPFILRRTKNEVARELPPVTEEVIYCAMTPDQSAFYHSEKSRIRNLLLENIHDSGISHSAVHILKALTQLRQIANHPFMVDPGYSGDSGKFTEVLRTVETIVSEGHRVLVFSSFVKHLRLFASWFERHKVNYRMLTGRTKDRGSMVSGFQKSEVPGVFLISMKAGGVGLNLTNADYVILLDPWWNPASEEQAISRAHRIGQDKKVFIYRFISLDTIEEKIINLKEKKDRISRMFINSSNPLRSFTVEGVMEMLE